jgi:hypothetical protein
MRGGHEGAGRRGRRARAQSLAATARAVRAPSGAPPPARGKSLQRGIFSLFEGTSGTRLRGERACFSVLLLYFSVVFSVLLLYFSVVFSVLYLSFSVIFSVLLLCAAPANERVRALALIGQ